MYVQRDNLDLEFNKRVKFLEKAYDCIILFDYSGDSFRAHIFTAGNIDEFQIIAIGTRDTTKERCYINLSRALKNTMFRAT